MQRSCNYAASAAWEPWEDGSYLAEFLLEKGYCVHGIIRRSSSFNTARNSRGLVFGAELVGVNIQTLTLKRSLPRMVSILSALVDFMSRTSFILTGS